MKNGEEEGESSGPSVLEAIRKEWTKAGSKDPSADDKAVAFAEWEKNRDARAKAEQALEGTIEQEAISVKKLAKLYGGRSLRYQGVVYDFASRGDRIFFRKKSAGVVDV